MNTYEVPKHGFHIIAEPGNVIVMLMIKEGILGFVVIPSSYKNGDQVKLTDGRTFVLAGYRANEIGYKPAGVPSTGSNSGGYG